MRQLRSDEAQVLEKLLGMAPRNSKLRVDGEVLVEDMNDGGMGSIRFAGESGRPRRMANELVTAEYIDEDNVPVLISVNLDEDGCLFEMDFWKVNFDPLRRYPRPEEVHQIPPSRTPNHAGSG